ncbi:MAG: cation:proton antiporter [Rhodothermales bacterium]
MELPLLPLLAVLAAAYGAGKLVERLGYPSVLGELLAGVILGPPLLGWLSGDPALNVIAELGILLMMLYVGMEIDPADLKKVSTGGILAALGGFITPFVMAYWAVTMFGGSVMEGLFVGMAAGVTSLATKSRILLDLKLLGTRIAHVMMAGALIADALSLIIFAGLIGMADPESGSSLWLVAGKMALFFGGTWAFGTFVLPMLSGKLKRGGMAVVFPFVIIVMLVLAEAAHLAGLHGILGAFLAGMFLRDNIIGQTVSREVMTFLKKGAIGFLAPVFFVTAGFEVDLAVVTESPTFLVVVIGVASIGKILGTAVFYLPTGFGWREGIVLGAGMNGRGAVEIIIAQIGLSLGIISQEVFSILVIMAIATTASVPVLLKIGVAWLRRRGELVEAGEHRKGCVIVGGGSLGRELGVVLGSNMPVTVVDTRPDNCDAARAAGLKAVQGSALDEIILDEAGAGSARYVLAITGNPGVDALIGRMAREEFAVPEVGLLYDASREREADHTATRDHVGGRTAFGGSVAIAEWDFAVTTGAFERKTVPFGERDSWPNHLFVAALVDGALVPAASGLRLSENTPCTILVQK